jgi:hypothetical protein
MRNEGNCITNYHFQLIRSIKNNFVNLILYQHISEKKKLNYSMHYSFEKNIYQDDYSMKWPRSQILLHNLCYLLFLKSKKVQHLRMNTFEMERIKVCHCTLNLMGKIIGCSCPFLACRNTMQHRSNSSHNAKHNN